MPVPLARLGVLVGAAVLPALAGAQAPAPAPASPATPAARSAQGRAFRPADVYRLTTVSAPAVSPDGRRVAFTVGTVREAENKYHREVWVVGLDGGAPARWTSPGTESSNPRWSPDGRWLYFTSTRPGAKATTWRLRADAPAGWR
jgi:hypothetical protein